MLRRYKITIAAIVILIVGISLSAALLQRPTYQARADIVVIPSADKTIAAAASASQVNDPVRTLGSEIRLLKGPLVRAAVVRQLRAAPPISVSQLTGTNIIRIKANSDSAGRASLIANTYANAYLGVRTAAAAAAASAAGRPIQDEIAKLQAQLARATPRQRIGLIKAQAAFEKELSQLQVGAAVHNAETRLLSAASPPGSPAHPRPIPMVAWALAIGVPLGLAAAFYRDYRDDSIRSDEELGAAWPDLAVWGLIPFAGPKRGDAEPPKLPSVHNPQSGPGEAYQALAQVIRARGLDAGGRVVQITSPTPGDGKTTTVANLGAILADRGRRVAIVCCDLRRPQLHHYFGLSNRVGLTSVITRQVPLDRVVFRVVDHPMLVAITAGPVPPNPAELLTSTRTAQILKALKGLVDVVLLDCPPVLGVTDSVVVSASADATVLVCRAGHTTHRHLSQAVDHLLLGGAPLEGIILIGQDRSDPNGPGRGGGGHRRRPGPLLSPQPR